MYRILMGKSPLAITAADGDERARQIRNREKFDAWKLEAEKFQLGDSAYRAIAEAGLREASVPGDDVMTTFCRRRMNSAKVFGSNPFLFFFNVLLSSLL